MSKCGKEREIQLPDLSWIDEIKLEKVGPKQPTDAITIDVYAERKGLTYGRAQKRLSEMEKAGLLEKGLFPNPNASGRIAYYWPKK